MSRNIQRTVKVTCPKCGSDQFVQPENPRPEDNVSCGSCGATYVIAELQEAAARHEAEQLADELVRSALGKLRK
ncbi:ECs_2282 family putative zinc-binding protein [Bordetella hinzii]|uniref:ECs_2282 family putative zinc-binding protein n=1 Tax=Bordetella hinzii TaxID=103855 RepID=UPI0039FDDEA2